MAMAWVHINFQILPSSLSCLYQGSKKSGKRSLGHLVYISDFIFSQIDDDSSTNDVIISVTCIYCNKSFPSKNSLDVHVLAMHDGKKIYDCSVCDKQFSHRSSRNIHLRVHTGQRPYECEICKKRFRVSSHLRDHVRTHTGKKKL